MEANNKAIREALVAINCIDTRSLKRLLCELVEADIPDGGQINKIIAAVDKAKAALATPPRQCDVGTVANQMSRKTEFCHKQRCRNCPFCESETLTQCALEWAQMPYEADDKRRSR